MISKAGYQQLVDESLDTVSFNLLARAELLDRAQLTVGWKIALDMLVTIVIVYSTLLRFARSRGVRVPELARR